MKEWVMMMRCSQFLNNVPGQQQREAPIEGHRQEKVGRSKENRNNIFEANIIANIFEANE